MEVEKRTLTTLKWPTPQATTMLQPLIEHHHQGEETKPKTPHTRKDFIHKFPNLNRHGQSLRSFQMFHIVEFQSKVKPSLLLTLSNNKTKIDLYYKSRSCIQSKIPLQQELNFSLTHENYKIICVHTMNICWKSHPECEGVGW